MREEDTTMIELDRRDGWRIKKEVSLGDIVAILIAVVAVMTAYMTLNTRIAVVESIATTNAASISVTISEIKVELRRLNDLMLKLIERQVVK